MPQPPSSPFPAKPLRPIAPPPSQPEKRPHFEGSARFRQIESHLHLVDSLVSQLFKKCGTSLRGLDRDDLIQEGRIGLIEAVDGFEPTRSSFKTHAFRCISDALADCLKANGRQIASFEQVLCEVEELAPAHDECDLRDLHGDLKEALCSLDDRTREAIDLHHLQGFTKAEVAAKLGISRGYCYEVIDAGLRSMKTHLQEGS